MEYGLSLVTLYGNEGVLVRKQQAKGCEPKSTRCRRRWRGRALRSITRSASAAPTAHCSSCRAIDISSEVGAIRLQDPMALRLAAHWQPEWAPFDSDMLAAAESLGRAPVPEPRARPSAVPPARPGATGRQGSGSRRPAAKEAPSPAHSARPPRLPRAPSCGSHGPSLRFGAVFTIKPN